MLLNKSNYLAVEWALKKVQTTKAFYTIIYGVTICR